MEGAAGGLTTAAGPTVDGCGRRAKIASSESFLAANTPASTRAVFAAGTRRLDAGVNIAGEATRGDLDDKARDLDDAAGVRATGDGPAMTAAVASGGPTVPGKGE